MERHGDIVEMTSYAPLRAKERHTQLNPDLIYFNNAEVNPTVGYYVQKLYGQNSGDKYVASKNKISDNNSSNSFFVSKNEFRIKAPILSTINLNIHM